MIYRPLDTAPAIWSEYNAVLDRMDGAARLNAAVELSVIGQRVDGLVTADSHIRPCL